MEDQIPHSFKVEWINTTLKFIKNDNQLIFEYPVMPVKLKDYLHNSLWLCKNDVSEPKSLYVPVMDALRIYSVKYEFKVIVHNSEDFTKGHLVIKKIPKKKLEIQDELKQEYEQLVYEDSQSSDCEDYERDQTLPESSTLNLTPAKNKARMRIRKSKSEKFFIDKQKIIESISPVLLKKSLMNILDFLMNKEEASIIFSNLAPVEARFLENFLGIYKKRQSFEETLTPACNNILSKMCEFFKEFDKQCKLEVYAAKCNVKTTKRQVKFMKVPRYTRNNANQPQTNHDAVQNIITENKLKISRNTPNPNLSETIKNNSLKVTISNGNTDSFDHTQNREVKSSNAEAKDNRIIDNNIDKIKLSTNAQVKDKRLIDNNTDATNNIDNNTEAKDNKKVVSSRNAETKDNRFVKNVEIAEDKELIKKEIETKKTVLPVKKTSAQIEKPIVNNNKAREDSPRVADGSRKGKLLQAMSTPLQSDKGSRMMRLMGWEGGALGLRGEGITEPIIPALNIVPGQGFGHVAEKPKPKQVKQAKTDHRVEFLKSILNLIRRESEIFSACYSVVLTVKEDRCFHNIIHNLNIRRPVTLTSAENVIVAKIKKIMDTEENLSLNLVITHDSKKLTLSKSLDLNLDTKADRKRNPKLLKDVKESTEKMSLDDMKIYFCTSILDFMKGENIWQEICFSVNLSKKFCTFTTIVCDCINRRTVVPFALVSKVSMEIMEYTKDCFLDAQFDCKIKSSVFVRKLYFDKPRINKEVVKCAINKYTNSAIPDVGKKNDKITEHADKKTIKTTKETIDQKAEDDNTANKAKPIKINDLDDPNKYRQNSSQQPSCSNEKKNTSKTDTLNDKMHKFNDNFKLKDNVLNNSIKVNRRTIQLIEDVARLNLNDLKRNTFTADNNNFKTKDIDLLQLTIHSLTSHNKHLEEVKIKLHNSVLHSNDRQNSNLLTDKQDILNENSDNSRKWYEPSETFIKRDDLVKNASVKNIDPNFKSHRVSDVKSDQYFKENEEKLVNLKINTTTDVAENIIEAEIGFNKDYEIESNKTYQKVEKHSELDVKQTKVFNSHGLEPSVHKAYSDSKNIINVDESKGNYNAVVELDESQETLQIQSTSDIIRVNNNDTKEDLRRISKDWTEELKETQQATEINSYSDIIPVKTDHNKDINDNNIEYFSANKTISEISKHCNDLVIIETNIIEAAEVHKRIQNIIENADHNNNGFLPLFKYHGVVEKGIVYSCHNKDTCLWLKSVLGEYNVIDYKSCINVHKVKINITSFNSDAKKLFELLEAYNKDLNCHNWKITSKNYLHYVLIIVVEIDNVSFKYICDNNFSLSVGYGVAQFSIGL